MVLILLSGIESWAEKVPVQEDVAVKLQKKILSEESKLGELEPWQKKIFLEEVVPQSQKFIRDFRQSTQGLSAEIDFKNIQNYLRFYGPKLFPQEKAGPQVLLMVKSESSCSKCTESLSDIKKLIKTRMERRGLVPSWVEPGSMPSAQASKKPVSLEVELKRAGGDDEDAAHADELKFLVRSTLIIRGLGKQEGQLEIFDTGNFEKTMSQILTDLFTEVGRKLENNSTQILDSDKNEYTMEVKGIHGFGHYEFVKNKILALVAGSKGGFPVTLEERKIARGRVVFALMTNKPLAEVKSFFSRLADEIVEPGTGQPGVQVEIRE